MNNFHQVNSFIPEKEFVVIEYPCNVKNIEKALNSLGGTHKINEVFHHDQMELSFTMSPNIFYNDVKSNHSLINGVLVRFKQMRNKKSGEIKVITENLGFVKYIYKFDDFCDFQYFPHKSKSDDMKFKGFYNQYQPNVYESEMDLCNYITNINELCFTPVSFTKGVKSKLLKYNKTVQEVKEKPSDDNCRISIILNKLFEDLPIWVFQEFNDEIYRQNIPMNKRFKVMQKAIAEPVFAGPWRHCWIKHTFNVSQEEKARNYQIIEYRATDYQVNFIKSCYAKLKNMSNVECFEVSKSKIGPKHLPNNSNNYYPLIYVDIPEVQSYVEQYKTDQYSEKMGWFSFDVTKECRLLISAFINQTIQKLKETYNSIDLD